MQPGGNPDRERYDINFQVLRPSSEGVRCYDEVGSNFLNDGQPGVTGVADIGATGVDIGRCVALTDIAPEDQIQVQPGDVVGFYAIQYRDGEQRDGGVQLNTAIDTVTVWNTPILSIPDPDVCPYHIGNNLASFSAAAPVITAEVGTLRLLFPPLL